jgi:L-asparaginase II
MRMLEAAGCTAADLECGAHMPIDRAAADALVRAGVPPTALHNNCSGKHAGFICVACHAGIDPAGYVGPDHPAQREVTAALAEVTNTALGPEVRAVDGCSIPTYAIPLDRLALAFARLVTGEGLASVRAKAAERLVAACVAEPFMVAGTGRFDTDAMSLFDSRLFVKTGAEGVYCGAFPDLGLGVALKCDDGAGRASEVLMAAVIEAFLQPTEEENAAFADRLIVPVFSRIGREVGEVRSVVGLVESLRDGKSLS